MNEMNGCGGAFGVAMAEVRLDSGSIVERQDDGKVGIDRRGPLDGGSYEAPAIRFKPFSIRFFAPFSPHRPIEKSNVIISSSRSIGSCCFLRVNDVYELFQAFTKSRSKCGRQ